MNKCSVGVLQNSGCHKNAYSNKTSLVSVSNLNDEEHQLLHVRIANQLQVQTTSLETVCMFRKYKYIQGHTALQKMCCDVFKPHKKLIWNASLRVINLDWYQKVVHHPTLNIVPAKKLCSLTLFLRRNCARWYGNSMYSHFRTFSLQEIVFSQRKFCWSFFYKLYSYQFNKPLIFLWFKIFSSIAFRWCITCDDRWCQAKVIHNQNCCYTRNTWVNTQGTAI